MVVRSEPAIGAAVTRLPRPPAGGRGPRVHPRRSPGGSDGLHPRARDTVDPRLCKPVSTRPMDLLAQFGGPRSRSVTGRGRTQDDRNSAPLGSVVISGCGLGLPGAEKPVMDPHNVERVLRGEQFVDLVPERFRVQMARKHVTRVVKSEDGSGSFETIDDTNDVIKLAGRPGPFDLTAGTVCRLGWSRRSTRPPSWPSPPVSTRCVRPASRWSRATGRRRPASSCPTAGCFRRRCATRPA